MAGGLAFVKMVRLVTHVHARAAWVLALHFITRLAWLAFVDIVARWAWGLRAAFATWRATVTCAVTRVLPWLAGIGGAWATAVVAAAFTAASKIATRIHAVLRRASPASASICAASTTTAA